jgi:DNA-binding GntR family transcriptional regulator
MFGRIQRLNPLIRMKKSRGAPMVSKAIAPLARTGRSAPEPPKGSVVKRPKASPLSVQAYEAIREKIVTLFFSPGQYLNEAAICEVLGLGRTPVHQALQRLQAEGLVEVIPRKGVIIQPDSIGQILDTLDARLVIEAELARRAAELATDKDAAELERILAIATRRHGGGAIDAFVESDRALHGKIAAMSGNQVLGDFARTLHERSTRFWYLHLWQTIEPVGSGKQHRAIVDAVRARDGAAAAAAMRTHILSLRERLQHIQHAAPRHGFHAIHR